MKKELHVKEKDTELTPFLDKSSDQQQSLEDNTTQKQGNIAKGVACAFPWAMVQASSMICVQALENRYLHICQ